MNFAMSTPEMHRALHVRSLQTIRAGHFACYRCGGCGIYRYHGTCFRCGGSGIDPQPPKHIAKSKRYIRLKEWAAQFDERGELKANEGSRALVR